MLPMSIGKTHFDLSVSTLKKMFYFNLKYMYCSERYTKTIMRTIFCSLPLWNHLSLFFFMKVNVQYCFVHFFHAILFTIWSIMSLFTCFVHYVLYLRYFLYSFRIQTYFQSLVTVLGCVGCGVGVHLTICARHASIWMSVNNLVDYIYLIVKY